MWPDGTIADWAPCAGDQSTRKQKNSHSREQLVLIHACVSYSIAGATMARPFKYLLASQRCLISLSCKLITLSYCVSRCAYNSWVIKGPFAKFGLNIALAQLEDELVSRPSYSICNSS